MSSILIFNQIVPIDNRIHFIAKQDYNYRYLTRTGSDSRTSVGFTGMGMGMGVEVYYRWHCTKSSDCQVRVRGAP